MNYPGTAVRLRDSRVAVVTWIQTMLQARGGGLLNIDGNFGPVTQAAVKTFQTQHGLESDGIVGAATWAALCNTRLEALLAPSSALTGCAVRVAQAYLGIHESGGPNRGPEIEKFLAMVGLAPGQPWCTAFQYAVFAEAARRTKVLNPMPRTGGVLRCWELAPDVFKISPVVTEDDVRAIAPGTLYLMDHGYGKGHMGIVVSAETDGLRGVEGNTNAAGSREGDGVRQKIRRYSEVTLGYLDFGRS